MRTFVFCAALRSTYSCDSEILKFNYTVIWGQSLAEAYGEYRQTLQALPLQEEGNCWEVVAMYEDRDFTALQYHLNWAASNVPFSAY